MVKNTLVRALPYTNASPVSGPHGDETHSLHCIDWIRQALMCNADLSLDATDNYRAFGQNGKHQCRNFGMILKWTNEHGYRGSLDELIELGDAMQLSEVP